MRLISIAQNKSHFIESRVSGIIYKRKYIYYAEGWGWGDEDVLKKAHNFTGPLLRLLLNFRRLPLQVFKIFNVPPKKKSEWKEDNPEFSLIIDTICSSSRCLIYSGTCFSSTDLEIPTCRFFHLTIAR